MAGVFYKRELDTLLCCCQYFCQNLFQHGPVLKMPLALQETLPASRRSYTARELRSGTDYLVTVIAQYPNSVGESVSAKQRTSEWKESRRQWWVIRINSEEHHSVVDIHRVPARGLQLTSGPGRVLLTVLELGPALDSSARLQTDLRTKRLGTTHRHTQRRTLISDRCEKTFWLLLLWHDGGPLISVLDLHCLVSWLWDLWIAAFPPQFGHQMKASF